MAFLQNNGFAYLLAPSAPPQPPHEYYQAGKIFCGSAENLPANHKIKAIKYEYKAISVIYWLAYKFRIRRSLGANHI